MEKSLKDYINEFEKEVKDSTEDTSFELWVYLQWIKDNLMDILEHDKTTDDVKDVELKELLFLVENILHKNMGKEVNQIGKILMKKDVLNTNQNEAENYEYTYDVKFVFADRKIKTFIGDNHFLDFTNKTEAIELFKIFGVIENQNNEQLSDEHYIFQTDWTIDELDSFTLHGKLNQTRKVN